MKPKRNVSKGAEKTNWSIHVRYKCCQILSIVHIFPGYLLGCDVCDFLDVVYFSAFYYDYISGQFSDLSQDLSMRTELEFINSGIDSINGLNLSPNITVLNLHHNRISKINGLTKATSLRYLDLSSNYISKICGLDNLQHLRILNLSSNKIRSIDSLENLK